MIQNPQFFIGVVEDVSDPEKLGRVKVRIFGKHSESYEDMPVKNLPWYTSVMPMTNPGIAGQGKTIGAQPGSWVFGLFIDGSDEQEALILGTVAGNSGGPPSINTGFSDPRRINPPVAGSDTPVTTVSDLQNKRVANRTINIPIARKPALSALNEGEELPEEQSISTPNPADYANPVYPYNNAEVFKGGHAVEYDSTPGHERYSHMHRSGTATDITADGEKIEHITGDGFTVYKKQNTVYIVGNCNLTVDRDINVKCGGDYVLDIDGNMHIQVDKDIKTKVKGNIQTECNGKREIMLDGSDFLDVKQSQTINITDDYGLNIKGDMGLDVKGPETKLFFNSADTEITFKKLDTTVNGDHKDMVTGNKHISSNAGMKINCPKKLIINTPIQQVSGDVRAGSGDVSLITHVHRQNNGKRDAGGGIDTAPSTGGTAPGS
jgi:hypothetical protein